MRMVARMHSKLWNLVPANPQAGDLAAQLKASPILAQAMLNRGLTDPQACRQFLSPSPKDLLEPSALANLPKAADRIARAIRDGEKIVIYGDYDVDGITATSILWHAIHCLGGKVDFYIPHRFEEGYGLNADALSQIIDRGARLIVTVDCGVTAIEPAAVARDRGVDLIITDHHEWKTTGECAALLPDCFTLVHPRLPTEADAYPNPHLCGAGVAFKLAWGVGQAMAGQQHVSEAFRRFLIDASALAALGTIADVVPLIGENRTLAKFGLSGLKQSTLTGLQALIDSAGLSGQTLDSYDVGFRLAPRLNACGRMGHAQLAVEMLTKADAVRAREIADYLDRQNRQRQTIERKILDQAMLQIADHGFDSDDSKALVLGAEGWHAGVIGIVAARLVERFHRPTVIVGFTNGSGQGSARSIAGFHLARALDVCGNCLQAHGGHEMAAGLRLDTDKFEDFRLAFCDYASRTVTDEMLKPRLNLEISAELSQITLPMVIDIKRLGPFGHGNPKPLFCCRGLSTAADARRVGKTGDHLQLVVRQGNATMKCIAFNAGEWSEKLKSGTMIDLAAEPTLNHYNGRTTVQLEIKDIRTPENNA
jgi:single-stranded-DNA-specific exonuclease